jgi:hypothetical protein
LPAVQLCLSLLASCPEKDDGRSVSGCIEAFLRGTIMAISDEAYNKASAILVKAGSQTAQKSHEKHTQGKGSPDGHGQALLREARDEFNGMPDPQKTAGRGAVVKAAQEMNIKNW